LGGVIKRIAIFTVFIAAALLVAGLFGVLHDQISYTVSNEYFTKFKFVQFHLLNSDVPEIVRVATVGFLASWWMGIPLGLLTGAAGFIQRTPAHMSRALALSLGVICAFVLVVALAGLAYGIARTAELDLTNYGGWFIPPELEHPRRFISVGYMHNSAYLGGAAAIPLAWVFHYFYRRRSAHAAQQIAAAGGDP
jgi:hypothetical protein